MQFFQIIDRAGILKIVNSVSFHKLLRVLLFKQIMRRAELLDVLLLLHYLRFPLFVKGKVHRTFVLASNLLFGLVIFIEAVVRFCIEEVDVLS